MSESQKTEIASILNLSTFYKLNKNSNPPKLHKKHCYELSQKDPINTVHKEGCKFSIARHQLFNIMAEMTYTSLFWGNNELDKEEGRGGSVG